MLSPASVSSTIGTVFMITASELRSNIQSTLNTYWISVSKVHAAFCALLVILWIGPCARFAQGQTPGPTPEEKLVAEFTDPLTTLPQISLRDAYSPANFGTHVQTNQVILRPIIPRLPAYPLLPFVQLIRPTFALVTVPSARGGSRTEFGDIELFDLGVLPWPSRETGLLIGVGPTLVFPTATSSRVLKNTK